ncbi:MAG: hypothetical protein HQL81_12340 [Magnetococcales bacterium]|nr:hypothetical protein [Magnetococcales bacterium]
MVTQRILLDSDAFLCMRKLAILDPLCRTHSLFVVMTSYIARHELKDLSKEVSALETNGCLSIHSVFVRTPEHSEFKRLSNNGIHKGEAEAIAWINGQPQDQKPAFISNDRGARTAAKENRVETGDVLDLLVCLVQLGSLTKGEAEQLTISWGEHPNAFCRPTHYMDFHTTFRTRNVNPELKHCANSDA